MSNIVKIQNTRILASSMTRTDDQDEPSTMGRSIEEINHDCHRLRQELEALRSNRSQWQKNRPKEIEVMKNQYRSEKEKLHRKLSEHANIATYSKFLRFHHREICNNNGKNKSRGTSSILPPSNYIIQQETPLLSAMHRAFCVLAHQIELLEREHECEIYPYFRKEIQDLHLDSQEMTDKWMSRLSDKAEENNALYDSYRTELESIETEIKRCRRQLNKKSGEKNLGGDNGGGHDESSILSETEHSTDSEGEDSSRGKDGVGLLKKGLQIFAGSPKEDPAAHSKIDAISGSFHEHLSKGGAAFQVAANAFLLPFTSKGN